MNLVERNGRVVAHEAWEEYHLLAIQAPAVAKRAHPGQFLMIQVEPSYFPLLRRPFSIHYSHDDRVEVFFKLVGTGTSLLAAKRCGDKINFIGPLGKGFTIPKEPAFGPLVLVGGGRGIAPLRFLAHELRAGGHLPVIFYGGQSKKDLPLTAYFQAEGFELLLATEDGSLGFRGLITELLEKEIPRLNPSRLYVCGPEAMMRRVSQLNQRWLIPAEFSLEAKMGCGFGVCYGCVWLIRNREKAEWTRICQEGPVFSGEAIIWRKA
ncbi:MAG: dihydroorotate dehydrogenase electron transfer subunit [Candidatus Aminicenantales bacterium]